MVYDEGICWRTVILYQFPNLLRWRQDTKTFLVCVLYFSTSFAVQRCLSRYCEKNIQRLGHRWRDGNLAQAGMIDTLLFGETVVVGRGREGRREPWWSGLDASLPWSGARVPLRSPAERCSLISLFKLWSGLCRGTTVGVNSWLASEARRYVLWVWWPGVWIEPSGSV